ncbi:sodium/glutamate symporter [Spirochaetota bacterium]
MDFSWKIVIDAGIISCAMILASFLRTKLKFLQRFMVPNSLTAGFLLLPVYNYFIPWLGYTQNRLGDLVYHLLNISFIAMTLRAKPAESKKTKNHSVWAMSTVILSQYAIQAFMGLILSWMIIKTVMPGLNPAFGLTLPLGYALGPGQAYAIGKGWEAMGFEGASSLGLTMAALGYLWACLVGVPLVNYGIRKNYIKMPPSFSDKGLRSGIVPPDAEKKITSRATTDIEAIDPLSFHAAIVAFTYLLSFLLLTGLSAILSLAGKAGTDLAANLWGINFIFSALSAMIVRKVIDLLKIGHVLDGDSLSRISGFSVDFMVSAALAAISLVFVGQYWLPIVVVGLIGGILTLVTTPWFCSRIFRDYRYERMVMLYGVSTGTLSTGLALLRIIDPEFKTKVSSDYILSAGLTFALAIPFILSINLPAKSGMTGNMTSFWLMVAVSLAYFVYSIAAFAIVAKKRAFKSIGKIWLEQD